MRALLLVLLLPSFLEAEDLCADLSRATALFAQPPDPYVSQPPAEIWTARLKPRRPLPLRPLPPLPELSEKEAEAYRPRVKAALDKAEDLVYNGVIVGADSPALTLRAFRAGRSVLIAANVCLADTEGYQCGARLLVADSRGVLRRGRQTEEVHKVWCRDGRFALLTSQGPFDGGYSMALSVEDLAGTMRYELYQCEGENCGHDAMGDLSDAVGELANATLFLGSEESVVIAGSKAELALWPDRTLAVFPSGAPAAWAPGAASPDPNWFAAAAEGDFARVSTMLAGKSKRSVDTVDELGRSALAYAAFRYARWNLSGEQIEAYRATLELLLDAGADPKRRDYLGNTPLHYAGVQCNVYALKLLLSRGADRSLKNGKGKSAQGLVAESGDWNPGDDCVEALSLLKTPPRR